MSEPTRHPDEIDPFESPREARLHWIERRREKAVEEILRNRRGEYTVPTWLLAVLLGAIVLGWVALIVLT